MEETGQRARVRRLLRVLATSIGAIFLALTALGLILPRDLRIERSVELGAPRGEVVTAVSDLSRWRSWAFGAEAAECTFTEARPEALRWRCGEVQGALLRTDLSEQALWIDAKVPGQIEGVRMRLSVIDAPTGARLTWQEQARAPRVIGAWLRPWLERARAEQIDAALARLQGQLGAAAPRGT